MRLTFVESRPFTARWKKRLPDSALRELQVQLMADPEAGRSIPGCGLLRKFRFGEEGRGKGKRGGVRVIYVFTPDAFRIDLVTMYGKDEKDDLTVNEVKELCSLARLLRDEAKAAFDRSVRSTARQGVQKRKGRS